MKKLFVLLAFALIAAPLSALAWEPTGDVNVIVAYKAGSGTDTGARVLASEAEKNIGKTLIINNLPGADGKIGWTQLVNAKPDGQTIGFINLPTFTSLTTEPDAAFTVADIVPIANHLTETGVVVVPASSPWKTIQDLVNAAKEKPDYRASTNGVKASNHIAAQLLAKSGGFDYKAIPYGGTADQLLALRQGEVDFSCAKVADVLPLVGGEKPEL
ncbi:MAG: tripartite tricarboxylate transporter substrate binding protein, partial [Desulfovibrio sp.]|nr:tripartite tricarboxylate transporter substrate binding protein [Desulfovibrio sp.]